MAWQDELVPMLRVMINDVGDTPDYGDDRLEDLILVAARYVNQELDFDWDYDVTFSTRTLSPDPVTNGDDAFINLTILKAACLVDQSTYRSKMVISGLSVRCGPVAMDTIQHLKGFKELLTVGPCAAYETLKKEWQLGNAKIVKAILSPFVGNSFDPSSLNNIYNDRDRKIWR